MPAILKHNVKAANVRSYLSRSSNIFIMFSLWVSFFPFSMLGVRWCCISKPEMVKCQDLMNVTSQVTSLASVKCVSGGGLDNCMKMIANGSADVITLGDEHIYQAGMLCASL